MSARFVTCPGCQRLMLGQHIDGATYPQPHDCATGATQAEQHADGELSHREIRGPEIADDVVTREGEA